MKKVFCFLLSAMFLFSVTVNAMASEQNLTDELSQKLTIVKERISGTDEYSEFSASKREYNEDVIYSFEWATNDEDVSRYLNVSLNSEDIITQYYRYDGKRSYNTKPSINRLSSQDAAKRAIELILEINPMLKNKISVRLPEYDSLYGGEYGFSIIRVENDIEVCGDTGYVSLDESASSITDFYLNYTVGLSFENPAGFISQEEAQEAYRSKLGLEPVYDIEYGNNRSRKVVLRYMPSEDNDTYISALDGSVYNLPREAVHHSAGGSASYNSAMKEAMADSASATVTFSLAEQSEIDKLADIMSVDDVKKSLYSNKTLNISEDSVLTENSVRRDYYDKDRYYYYLNFESENEGCTYYLCCDAKNARIITYRRYGGNTNGEYSLTEEQAQEKAEELARELARDFFTSDENNTYIMSDVTSDGISCKRVVNGIKCLFGGIEASVSRYDGNLNSFSVSHDYLEFPEAEGIVSTEAATATLFDEYDYKLIYLPVNTEGTLSAVPVYSFEDGVIEIDAFTGQAEGKTNESKIIPYTDMNNHYAQEQAEKLQRFGIGFAGGEFKPENKITQGEYLTLLSAVFGGQNTPIILREGYDYSSAYNYAKRMGVISETEINEDIILTRESAAVMLIKAMGYDEIASLDDIYIPVFSDVGSSLGHIAILNKLGVINGDGNSNFYPDKELTRSEAITIIYNYLSR